MLDAIVSGGAPHAGTNARPMQKRREGPRCSFRLHQRQRATETPKARPLGVAVTRFGETAV